MQPWGTFKEAKLLVMDAAIPRRFKGDRRKFFIAIRGDLMRQESYRVGVLVREAAHRAGYRAELMRDYDGSSYYVYAKRK